MGKAIKTIIQEIEKKLDIREDFIEFKIGKTNNIEERKFGYENEGYPYIWEIGYGEPDVITEAEKILIQYFRDESPYKDRCKNIQEGGGNPKSNKLYLAVKPNKLDYDNLLDDYVDIGSLPLNIKHDETDNSNSNL